MEILLLEAGGRAHVWGGHQRTVEVIGPLMVGTDDHASAGDAAGQRHPHGLRLRRGSAKPRSAMPAHIVESAQWAFTLAHQQDALTEQVQNQVIARIRQFFLAARRNPLPVEYPFLFGSKNLRAAIPAGGEGGVKL